MTFLEFLQYVGSEWGIAAIFAIVMFFIYRKTVAQMDKDRQCVETRMINEREATEERDERLLSAYNRTIERATEAAVETSKINSELLSYLKGQNSH